MTFRNEVLLLLEWIQSFVFVFVFAFCQIEFKKEAPDNFTIDIPSSSRYQFESETCELSLGSEMQSLRGTLFLLRGIGKQFTHIARKLPVEIISETWLKIPSTTEEWLIEELEASDFQQIGDFYFECM